jgi:hypothetical protein
MSKNTIVLLIYHCHRLSDLIHFMSCLYDVLALVLSLKIQIHMSQVLRVGPLCSPDPVTALQKALPIMLKPEPS